MAHAGFGNFDSAKYEAVRADAEVGSTREGWKVTSPTSGALRNKCQNLNAEYRSFFSRLLVLLGSQMGNTAGLCKLSSSTFAEDRSIIGAQRRLRKCTLARPRSSANIVLCFRFAGTFGDFGGSDGARHTCFYGCCCATLSYPSFSLCVYACYLKRLFPRHCWIIMDYGVTNFCFA